MSYNEKPRPLSIMWGQKTLEKATWGKWEGKWGGERETIRLVAVQVAYTTTNYAYLAKEDEGNVFEGQFLSSLSLPLPLPLPSPWILPSRLKINLQESWFVVESVKNDKTILIIFKFAVKSIEKWRFPFIFAMPYHCFCAFHYACKLCY